MVPGVFRVHGLFATPDPILQDDHKSLALIGLHVNQDYYALVLDLNWKDGPSLQLNARGTYCFGFSRANEPRIECAPPYSSFVEKPT